MSFSFDSVAHLYKGVYYRMPQSLKTFLGSIYGAIPIEKRYGVAYSDFLNIFEKFESWDDTLKEEYLYYKTLETLMFAEQNITFYQKQFAKYGVCVSDFKSLGDLKKFPTMTKRDIKESIDDLYTDVMEKPAAYFSGGSTSSPTKFYHPLFTSRAKHKAYSIFTLKKAGYNYRDATLLLKGREVVDKSRNIYWDYEAVENMLNVTSGYIMSDKFPLIYKKAASFKPKFIFGYPSAVMDFMYATKAAGYEPLNIKGILLASESVYDEYIKELKDFYGDIPVFIDYGHTERVVGAYRIDNMPYNFLGAYGVTRLVDDEIVGTSLDNFVMPYINYKTGDEAEGKVSFYKNSDIVKSVSNIKGRKEDYLVTYDYRLISLTTLYVGHHLCSKVVANLQYIQKEPGKVIARIEKGKAYADKEKIYGGLKNLVKEGIDFKVEIVDKIEKSARGKWIACKQYLDIESIKAKRVKNIGIIAKAKASV